MDIPEYRIVGLDYIEVGSDEVKVSTVWLGLDHGFPWIKQPPVIFETMIFGGTWDHRMWRYCTHLEAIAGHADAVALVRREAHVLSSPLEDGCPAPEPPSDR